jgi:hypothetical protein
VEEKERVRQAWAILTARAEGALDEWSSVSDLRAGQTLNTPTKEVSMYIGIGTALLIIIVLLILL